MMTTGAKETLVRYLRFARNAMVCKLEGPAGHAPMEHAALVRRTVES